MSDARYWRLTIEKGNGSCVSVLATEEILRGELDAWVSFENRDSEEWAEAEKSAQEHVSTAGYKVRLIHGVSDDASRTDVIIAYRFHDVIGMALVEMR